MPARVKSVALMLALDCFLWLFALVSFDVNNHPLQLFSLTWWLTAIIIGICGGTLEAQAYDRHSNQPK